MGEESTTNRFRFASEMDRIFESEEFSRSPVMRRLLRFLVDQTLVGNGDQLKAYSVAVDGLGRAPDFDAQTDSYPRVQVGRLRRMLDAHYARNGFPNGERLLIPSGAYRVYLNPVYPRPERVDRTPENFAWRQASQEVLSSVTLGTGSPNSSPDTSQSRSGAFRIGLLKAIGAALALLAAYWVFANRPFLAGSKALTQPPNMLLLPVERSVNSPAGLSSSVDQMLGDALHRSWIVNVHSADETRISSGNSEAEEDYGYRLQSVLAGTRGDELYLTLWNSRTGDRIWTDHIPLTEPKPDLEASFRTSVANLIGSFGVIAAQERQNLGSAAPPGYACLLKAAEYRIWYSKEVLEASRKCLDETLALEGNSVPATLAASATVNARLAKFVPQRARTLRAEAEAQANRALLLDPYSAEANMISATLATKAGRCPLAKNLGRRAIELNAYEPEYYARFGMILFQCDDPADEKFLTLARQLDPQLPAFFAIPIIAAMGERGEARAALDLALSLPTATPTQRPLYSVTLALAYAQSGNRARAARYWRELSAAPHNANLRPLEILNRLLVNPNLARRTGMLLVKAGLVSAL